jgi:hypothetical protein
MSFPTNTELVGDEIAIHEEYSITCKFCKVVIEIESCPICFSNFSNLTEISTEMTDLLSRR